MEKPISVIIKETKDKIINACNESGLSAVILDLIMQNIYSEVHSLADRQILEEENAYVKMLDESTKAVDNDGATE